MKNRKLLTALAIATTLTSATAIVAPTYAQTVQAAQVTALLDQSFFKKKYKISGAWSLTERDGKKFITFSDKFKTKGGPDLKVFLSPKSEKDVSGKNALEGSIKLGELIKTKGTQEYEIPANVDLAQYSTVLIHCEAYSILWGGGVL